MVDPDWLNDLVYFIRENNVVVVTPKGLPPFAMGFSKIT